MKVNGKGIGVTLGIGTLVGYIFNFDPQLFVNFLGESAQNEIVRAGFFFTLAAWIHARQVKKEIANQVEPMTAAVNSVAVALREDLKSHTTQLNKLTDVVSEMKTQFGKLDERVSNLEKQPQQGE